MKETKWWDLQGNVSPLIQMVVGGLASFVLRILQPRTCRKHWWKTATSTTACTENVLGPAENPEGYQNLVEQYRNQKFR